ncbi:hypothetical protein GIB67_039368, partial [Kingdonia uniflora]
MTRDSLSFYYHFLSSIYCFQPINKKSGSPKSGASRKGKGGGLSKASGSVKHEDVEPSEISLDEIESGLGSLLEANTISQLKSGVWKERLE